MSLACPKQRKVHFMRGIKGYLEDADESNHTKWGFPKIRGTFLGVPVIRTIVFWGLYGGPLNLGNYQINPEMEP